MDGEVHEVGLDGRIHLNGLRHPVLAVVSAPGHLSEPVAVGRDDRKEPVDVPLLSAAGRHVVHTAGDMMMGPRYLDGNDGYAHVDPDDEGSSARAVVSDIAPAFSLADLSMVNLETVIGARPDADAYPGKRYLLQTPPSALAALDALGADLTVLANNHQRDWLDAGITDGLGFLDAVGQEHVGAAITDEAARATWTDDADWKVAVLAYTAVDGDTVNDQYPVDGDVGEDCADDSTWCFVTWGMPELGLPVEPHRIGTAWALVTGLEAQLDDDARARLCASASAAYPELQDWVARRGHGGANRWDADRSPGEIAVAQASADLVVVQLHMSFQFADVPSAGTRADARAAIDAGADLVVCHHPHVLQGLEWYRGHLIAWSMGNFAFDQDFLSTFRSAFLRTVWDDDGALVQARVVPLFLDHYRPVPVTGAMATDVLRRLWEGSLLDADADRGEDRVVRTVAEPPGAESLPVSFRLEHGTAVLGTASSSSTRTVHVPGDAPVSIADLPLVRRRLTDDAGIEVGRSLYGLGRFEDDDADGDAGDELGWTWQGESVSLTAAGVRSGVGALQLIRGPTDEDRVSARSLARVPLVDHRLFADADGEAPLDGVASLAMFLRAWVSGEGDAGSVRVQLYNFDDLDMTEDPESTFLREVEIPFDAVPGAWNDVWLPLSAADLAPVDGLVVNAALLYVSLSPPTRRATVLRVDDVDLVEWRPVAQEPEGWAAIDWLRSTDGQARDVEVEAHVW